MTELKNKIKVTIVDCPNSRANEITEKVKDLLESQGETFEVNILKFDDEKSSIEINIGKGNEKTEEKLLIVDEMMSLRNNLADNIFVLHAKQQFDMPKITLNDQSCYEPKFKKNHNKNIKPSQKSFLNKGRR